MPQQPGTQSAAQQPLQRYTIFWNNEWHIPEPDYYWVMEVEGRNPQDAFETNMPEILRAVRKMLELGEDELSDYHIQESLYITPSDSWVSYYDVDWQARLSTPVKPYGG